MEKFDSHTMLYSADTCYESKNQPVIPPKGSR
jgi:hypothetical protein